MYYIYHYIDPRTDLPFYVGKGTGNRLFDHLTETEETTENRHKFYKIQYLRNIGLDPIVKKIFENIEEEVIAYEIESNEILKYGRIGYEDNGILTNICIGNYPPNHTGKSKSLEHREKLSKSRIGKIASDSTKKKNSEITQSRIRDGTFGHNVPHTQESKLKTSITKKSQELKWYNNGEKSKLFSINDFIPENFIPGRVDGKRGPNKEK
jgi:hypothetical protein